MHVQRKLKKSIWWNYKLYDIDVISASIIDFKVMKYILKQVMWLFIIWKEYMYID